MCGIVGFINCGTKQELAEAVSVIKHRGPDNQSSKWFESLNSGLGHARLSIIDLSESANQPFYDKETGNWIVFNGEIFNYKDIQNELGKAGYSFRSNSDTEVLIKAYHKWGKDCLTKLNGMFAFAIINENTGDLFAARDRLGIKPFYYYNDNGKFIFASEIKSILKCSDYKIEPDYNSLLTPVHFQISPYTGFKSIYKLNAGHYISKVAEELNIIKYWDINPQESHLSYGEVFEELDYLLNDSIRLQMISDVPIGSLLSGGLDSSIISVLMQKHMKQPLNTFTIKFNKKDLKRQGNVDDSYYARKLAEQFGFNHKEILIEPDITDLLPKMIWHLDEPIADPSSINTYLISKVAREQGIKVLLSGMGADEVFSGYRSHLACIKAEQYQKLPLFMRRGMESLLRYIPESSQNRNFKYIRWVKQFLNVASLNQLERYIAIGNSGLKENNFNVYFQNEMSYYDTIYFKKANSYYSVYPELDYLSKLCFMDSKIYLTDHNLAYSDKSMMAAGVEGRPPLIDHRIVELMFNVPNHFRINKNIQKYILKKVSEKYLPKEIIYRPKAPFSAPMRGWLRNELKEMVNDILSYDSIQKRGIYNPQYVQRLIQNNNKGVEDNSQLIWRLMVNEIWFRTFFQN